MYKEILYPLRVSNIIIREISDLALIVDANGEFAVSF